MTETNEQPPRAATTPEIMQALRLLVDRQQEIRHLSGETYQTVLPLTALLDLLHRALATPGARTMARIEALSARHPKIIVATFLTQHGVPRLLSMDRLKWFVQSRSKEADRVADMNPPEKGNDLGPDFH